MRILQFFYFFKNIFNSDDKRTLKIRYVSSIILMQTCQKLGKIIQNFSSETAAFYLGLPCSLPAFGVETVLNSLHGVPFSLSKDSSVLLKEYEDIALVARYLLAFDFMEELNSFFRPNQIPDYINKRIALKNSWLQSPKVFTKVPFSTSLLP